MSRYEFTEPKTGYKIGFTIEARTATEARDIAIARNGSIPMLCSHLSSTPEPVGMDAMFFYGPDGVDN